MIISFLTDILKNYQTICATVSLISDIKSERNVFEWMSVKWTQQRTKRTLLHSLFIALNNIQSSVRSPRSGLKAFAPLLLKVWRPKISTLHIFFFRLETRLTVHCKKNLCMQPEPVLLSKPLWYKQDAAHQPNWTTYKNWMCLTRYQWALGRGK